MVHSKSRRKWTTALQTKGEAGFQHPRMEAACGWLREGVWGWVWISVSGCDMDMGMVDICLFSGFGLDARARRHAAAERVTTARGDAVKGRMRGCARPCAKCARALQTKGETRFRKRESAVSECTSAGVGWRGVRLARGASATAPLLNQTPMVGFPLTLHSFAIFNQQGWLR